MSEEKNKEEIVDEKKDTKEAKEEMKEETKEENKVEEKVEEENPELKEMEDRYKRLLAEFENFKKRNLKEKEMLRNMLVSDIMTMILPVIDNLEKAANTETEDKAYQDGVKMVLKQLQDVLISNGVKEIETVGKPFDPELHEAVSHVQDEKIGKNIVKEEFRKGYIIGNKVIRHSMVIVAN